MRPTLRTLLFRTHWILGLSAGLVLALVGLTGALMSYEEAVVDALNRSRLAVSPDGRTRLGPEALIARVEAQHPGLRVAGLTVAADPGAAVRVRFANEGSGERPASLYADPYDGSDRGVVVGEETFATIRTLHRYLLIPGGGRGWGRTVTGICAIALIVFLATGLYLRWPRLHGWKVWLRPSLRVAGRPRWWSLHAVMGTWMVPVYCIFAMTGLWWSFDAYKAGATYLLTGRWPEARAERAERPRKAGGEAVGGERRRERAPARPVALDKAWDAFRAGPGAEAPVAVVTLPGERESGIRIRYLAHADDPPKARSEMSFDAATGALLASERAEDKPLGRQVADNMLEVHRGRFFGPVVALVFCLAALAMPLFSGTGITLWILRRRAARKRAPVPERTVAARA